LRGLSAAFYANVGGRESRNQARALRKISAAQGLSRRRLELERRPEHLFPSKDKHLAYQALKKMHASPAFTDDNA
jgi:hypothetical protein